jgi:hypothetical protein
MEKKNDGRKRYTAPDLDRVKDSNSDIVRTDFKDGARLSDIENNAVEIILDDYKGVHAIPKTRKKVALTGMVKEERLIKEIVEGIK